MCFEVWVEWFGGCNDVFDVWCVFGVDWFEVIFGMFDDEFVKLVD